MIKNTIYDMVKLASGYGGYCLSDIYVNARSKLLWQCKFGHEWLARPDTIKGGSWCRKCATNKSKNTIEDATLLAKSKGGYCRSEEYISNMKHLVWECKYRHKWKASYSSVYSGSWCPGCAKNKRKTIEDARMLAESKNGNCISDEYTNNSTKLQFSCEQGHIFSASYSNVYLGKWCPLCAKDKLRKSIDDCKALAIKMGGHCLSDKYINNVTKLLWKCSLGHKWYTTYTCVSSGCWCPVCNKYGGVTQNRLAKIVKKLAGAEVFQNFREFDWLINDETGKRLEIDIWIPEHKIAIEYDGEQHFRPITFGNMSTDLAKINFEHIQKRDVIKEIKISNNTDVKYFIRFNYKDNITISNVEMRLKSFGIL